MRCYNQRPFSRSFYAKLSAWWVAGLCDQMVLVAPCVRVSLRLAVTKSVEPPLLPTHEWIIVDAGSIYAHFSIRLSICLIYGLIHLYTLFICMPLLRVVAVHLLIYFHLVSTFYFSQHVLMIYIYIYISFSLYIYSLYGNYLY